MKHSSRRSSFTTHAAVSGTGCGVRFGPATITLQSPRQTTARPRHTLPAFGATPNLTEKAPCRTAVGRTEPLVVQSVPTFCAARELQLLPDLRTLHHRKTSSLYATARRPSEARESSPCPSPLPDSLSQPVPAGDRRPIVVCHRAGKMSPTCPTGVWQSLPLCSPARRHSAALVDARAAPATLVEGGAGPLP